VRSGSIQRQTLRVCLVLALGTAAGAALVGQPSLGAGLGLGVLIGSLNGFTFRAVIERRAPILATSILRLGFFSLLAIAAARLTGGSIWPVALGVGMAQLAMVAVGARQGLRE
jgi:hypothetical protein